MADLSPPVPPPTPERLAYLREHPGAATIDDVLGLVSEVEGWRHAQAAIRSVCGGARDAR